MLAKKPSLLVTTDFSLAATHAFGPAMDLARRLGGSVVLLYAYTPIEPPMVPGLSQERLDELHREHREKALKELERLSEAHFGDLDRRTVVVDGPPARAIVHYASEHSVDLIVMADSGLHGLRGTLLGSVCQRVLLRAPCPVLVVPKSLPGTPSP
ncbi:MAG: universal stress protein [Acidobacteria bacterium]|nr:universal stress protein [Acidobacteriota bacterium]